VDVAIKAGLDAQARGDLVAAEASYRSVLDVDASEPRAIQLLGALLVDRNEHDEALELFERAASRVGPVSRLNAGFYNNYANSLRRAGRLDDAEAMLRSLVATVPNEWQPWHNLGQALKERKHDDEAIAALRRAVSLAPDHGPNHAVLGEVLHHIGRLRSAHASLQRCIDLGWDRDPNLWTILGNNHRLLGELDDALRCLEHAMELTGGAASSRSNVAIALAQRGRFDESLAQFARAVELEPDNPLQHSNRAYGLLTAGVVSEGWAEWEFGLQDGPRGTERLAGPRWTPSERDARVLCYREQGVGDEILFASCYPDLVAAAREVVIECDSRLVELFARSFPSAEVRPQTFDPRRGETAHDFDCAIPAGSLPQLFRPAVDAFPARRGFLEPNVNRVDAWRARLADLGPGPYVGISWRSRIKTAERRLEYTRLEEWGELFAIPDITWVNLQYDDCERELREAESRFGVHIHRWSWLDLMNDFDEVAALTSALDLVVAPRNAVAMLGGALGARTVMMGNRWDWSDLGTDTCPWLPTVELVYRHVGEDWNTVLATAAARVREVREGREVRCSI
jgi:tetratricopeptide (TPR) repeat protein